jgi:hypothetical protein
VRNRNDTPAKEITINFVSIRIITGDIKRLVGFYERATGVTATWSTEDFASPVLEEQEGH